MAVLLLGLLIQALWVSTVDARDPAKRVYNLNDTGPGSLRSAIFDAAFGGNIVYDSDLSGTILLQSNLPDVNRRSEFENYEGITLSYTGGTNIHLINFSGPGWMPASSAQSLEISGSGNLSAIKLEAYLNLGRLFSNIHVVSEGARAYGIQCTSGDLLLDDYSGSMVVNARDSFAFGIYSGNDLSLNRISGSIQAKTGDYFAYALHSNNDMRFDSLSGRFSAEAKGPFAVGIYSSGQLVGNLSPFGQISGVVTASAHGPAVAVGAKNGMDIKVIGTLVAQDTSGNDQAYAIASGEADMISWLMGNHPYWDTQGGADDKVVLGDGASITGHIDLGDGVNRLTLEGSGRHYGHVNNVTSMTKTGSGTWESGNVAVKNLLSVNAGHLDLSSGTRHFIGINPVGTNLSISPGASLSLGIHEIDQPNMVVSNTLVNRGTINITPKTYIPPGKTVTVVTSQELNNLGVLTTDALVLDIAAQGNNITVTKKNYRDIPLKTANARLLAKTLDTRTLSSDSDMAHVVAMLDSSTSLATFEDGLNQMGPQALSGMSAVTMDMSRLFFSTVTARMARLRQGVRVLARKKRMDPNDPETWPLMASAGELAGILFDPSQDSHQGLHFQALGQKSHMDSQEGHMGYDTTTAALAMGMDRVFPQAVLDNNFLGGLSIGVADSSVLYRDRGQSNADITTYSLGVYGSFFDKHWYLDTILAGASSAYEVNRSIPFLSRWAKSNPKGYTLSAKTRGGYTFDLGKLGLTPILSLEYNRLHQDAYTETGASGANLGVAAWDDNSLKTGLGVQVDRSWATGFGSIIQSLSLCWEHELLTPSRQVSTTIAGMPGLVYTSFLNAPDRDALVVDASVTSVTTSSLALSLTYQGRFLEDSGSHSLIGDLKILF
ncbi:MAG: autotransporter domain-containing protein [Desulfobacter sp.]|nr:autotransporter domain-containing protein [Desulfobacter sp.]